jgi:F-type H+-transporting ATPase subunit b
MPQLDPASFPPQLIWLAITFILLYVLMAKVALPRVGAVLEERKNRIDDDLGRASATKAEADAATEAYEAGLAEARAAAQQTIREATEKAARESAERQHAAAERVSAQIAEAETVIGAARQEALGSLRDMAASAAGLVAKRLTGSAPDQAAVDSAVDAAMKERA